MIYLSICGPTSHYSVSVVLVATSSYAYLLLILVILLQLEYYLFVGNVLGQYEPIPVLVYTLVRALVIIYQSAVCIEYYYYIKSSYYDARTTRTLHNIPYPYYDSQLVCIVILLQPVCMILLCIVEYYYQLVVCILARVLLLEQEYAYYTCVLQYDSYCSMHTTCGGMDCWLYLCGTPPQINIILALLLQLTTLVLRVLQYYQEIMYKYA